MPDASFYHTFLHISLDLHLVDLVSSTTPGLCHHPQESLDARNGTLLFGSAKSHSALSQESADSGIYDLDETYSHVITEHSPADVIAQVERSFQAPYELGGSIGRAQGAVQRTAAPPPADRDRAGKGQGGGGV